MRDHERWERILEVLAQEGRVRNADLAARVGVSAMTIRRDLAALDGSARLRRVHGGAIALGLPSASVRIGMVVPSSDYYFPGIVRGADAAARQRGGELVTASSNQSTRAQLQCIADFIAEGVDGLIITPTGHVANDSDTYRALCSAPVPVTLIERFIDESDEMRQLDIVRSDHAHGAVTAVGHLAASGHRRIALVLRNSPTASRLRDGYLRALMRYSLDAPSVHVISVHDGTAEAAVRLGDIADAMLRTGVTAALVLPDSDAGLLAEQLRERGIRIPSDFSIVSYDDETAAAAPVPLTSVAPQKSELGRLAANCCLDRIAADREGRPCAVKHITVFPELRVRESTAPVPDPVQTTAVHA